MSNLIVPPYAGAVTERKEIRLPPIEIPRLLREDFAVNPHIEPLFFKSVAQAVNISLNTPETALREITEKALAARIELCYKAMEVLRFDLKYSLRKCLDLLPQKLTEALLKGERLEDVIDQAASAANAWKGNAPDEIVTMSKDELADGEIKDE